MMVTLKLKSGLEKYLEKNVIEMDLTCNKSLIDILREINFPEEKAGIVLIDGKIGNKNCVLRGGETVKIFPQTIGC
jgi:hypothetical protein